MSGKLTFPLEQMVLVGFLPISVHCSFGTNLSIFQWSPSQMRFNISVEAVPIYVLLRFCFLKFIYVFMPFSGHVKCLCCCFLKFISLINIHCSHECCFC